MPTMIRSLPFRWWKNQFFRACFKNPTQFFFSTVSNLFSLNHQIFSIAWYVQKFTISSTINFSLSRFLTLAISTLYYSKPTHRIHNYFLFFTSFYYHCWPHRFSLQFLCPIRYVRANNCIYMTCHKEPV